MNEQLRPQIARDRCPYCHDGIGGEGLKQGCPACMAWHHRECWDENGAECAACGFAQASAAADEPEPAEAWFVDELPNWPARELRNAVTVYRDEYTASQRRAIERELERRPEQKDERVTDYAGTVRGFVLFVIALITLGLALTLLIAIAS